MGFKASIQNDFQWIPYLTILSSGWEDFENIGILFPRINTESQDTVINPELLNQQMASCM